jgi:serine/threonine protein kinase
VKTIA